MKASHTRLAVTAVVTLLIAAPASAATVAPSSPGCVARATPPVAGTLTVVSAKQLDARVTDLTVYSPAMQQDENVNVMLPVGYNPDGTRRYPVLYLLHGALGGYMDWYDNGVEQLIGNLPLIVVMPEDGYDGSYSDWYGLLQGQTGPVPAWQTFHTRELIPFIDSHYLTIASRGDRFIAGVSSGGAGATKYAAANPGMFGAVGSFSGANDTDVQWPFYPTLSEGLWAATDAPGDGPDGHCTWGDPYTQRVIWEDNDSNYLAPNLQGTPLFLASGNGLPGPLDPSVVPSASDPTQALSNAGDIVADGLTESEIWDMNKAFVKTLNAAGIPHTDYFYGDGTHSWPYWERDLQHFLVWLAPYVGHPLPRPATFSFRSADDSFSAWEWSFSVTREVREFVYLSGVSRHGLTALGSGTLAVTTAPLYRPGGTYSVASDGLHSTVRAGADGRLRFPVDMGPSHTVQQYRFGRDATLGWQRTVVTIAAG
jgi:diacylglycerol O-acyltransferase / trehalose O-mycolyltransferase